MIGPVQLLVVGFDQPELDGAVLAQLRSLREHDMVRVIDILLEKKDADGLVSAIEISGLSEDEAQELGAVVEGLIGLGTAAGDAMGAAGLWSQEQVLGDEDVLDLLAEIPQDTAVAITLLEHRWAIPLRQAIVAAGGFPVVDAWLHPRDLVEVGLLAAAEAAQALS